MKLNNTARPSISAELKMPFKIPIEDNVKLVTTYPDFIFQTTFLSTNIKKELLEYIPSDYVISTTFVLECFINNEEETKENINELLVWYINTSIQYINQLVNSLKISFGLKDIKEISIADFPLYIRIKCFGKDYLYLTRPLIFIEDKKNIGEDEIPKLLDIMQSQDLYHEMYLIEKFLEDALTYISREVYVMAIINLQTSFELFVRQSVRIILIKSNFTESRINELTSIPFKNLLEQQLSKYLKTDFQFNIEGTVINDWYKKLYRPRNEIVHNGRVFISSVEAYEAYDAYCKARQLICDCMIKQKYLGLNSEYQPLEIFPNRKLDENERNIGLQKAIKLGLLPDNVLSDLDRGHKDDFSGHFINFIQRCKKAFVQVFR